MNHRCDEPGCSKGAAGGQSKRKCVAHGGGKRCDEEGCTKAARGTTGKCTAHGGGYR